ncbi:MAG: DNA methyltransferase [Candidatus ainarchaeum sp.]|nr:DNA methyltransferase [Candidatus ainarchaeum sp.]MDD3975726.1 DNA methyltransferase [Candidatus ainarchaeum sp.]
MGISIIETNRYSLHPFNGRKYWGIVQKVILENTSENSLILDPFMGSGTTIIESLILNRKVIGVDVTPLSHFIVTETLKNITIDKLNLEFKNINLLKPIFFKLYKSKECCNCCGSNLIVYSFVINNFTSFFCPKCNSIIKKNTPPNFILNSFDDFNYNNKYIPNNKIPANFNSNVNFIKDLYSQRNLIGLCLLLEFIDKIKCEDVKNYFKFIFSSNLGKSSKLNILKNNNRWKTINTFKVPEVYVNFNIWFGFLNKIKKAIDLKCEINKFNLDLNHLQLILDDSKNLNLKNNLVDCIICDPPYYKDISYACNSYLHLSWINLNYLNKFNFDSLDIMDSKTFDENLLCIFKNCFKILKKDGFFVLILSNISVDYTESLINILNKSNFILISKMFSKEFDLLDYVILKFKKKNI